MNLRSNTLKVTVGVLVGFLLYRKRTYFLVKSPKPDGKAKYQEILPLNLTVKGWPLIVANWLVTSGFGRLIGFPGNVETMISMGHRLIYIFYSGGPLILCTLYFVTNYFVKNKNTNSQLLFLINPLISKRPRVDVFGLSVLK